MTADAPIVHNNRRFFAVVLVFFACGVVVAIVAGMAMATARQADQRSIATAQQQLEESQANLVASHVAACESRNQARADTRTVFLALLEIASRGEPETPSVAQFRAFVDEAYDPVNCEYGAPDFNVDPVPATLPEQGGI